MWKEPCAKFVPQSAVQVIPIDFDGRMLVMHRSPTVRSAPNVWSFPSGLHDIGETVIDCARRELYEEYGLQLLDSGIAGVYENIAGDSGPGAQYHWVITVVVGLVPDVRVAANKEPDKHDQMLFIQRGNLGVPEFLQEHPFHRSFHNWITSTRWRVQDVYEHLLRKSIRE